MVSDLPLESLSDEALVEEMIIDFKTKSTMLPTNLKNRNPMNITDLEKLTSKIGELRKTKPGNFASDSDFARKIATQAKNFKIQRCDEFFDLQICQYVVEMVNLQSEHKGEFNPFSILIHGHPSSGKTTSLLTIADTLSKLIEQKSILPLYSELQISDTHNVVDDNLIWSRVISGVREYNIRTSKLAESFDEYVKFTQENNKIPLIVIDTVDVLLTNMENKEKFVEGWIKFLEKGHNSGVNIIFTSRTQEWNTAIEPLQTPITDISLPELLLYQIEPYHFAVGEKIYPGKFEQFTRVIQALMPLIVDKRDKNYYKESTEELRKYLQQNDLDPSSLNRRELEHHAIKIHKNNNLQSSFSIEFIEKLYDWFENKLDSPIINYTDTIALVNDSPIKLFFDYCWNEWKSNNKKRFTDEQIDEFMRCFCEAIFQISKSEINSLTKKIFFDIDRVISIVKLNNAVNISRDNISKMMNSLTKTDLLNYRAGKFSFAHQLLHTLTISNTEDNKKHEYLDELTNYIPSDSRDFIRLIGGVYTWREPSENEDDRKTTDNHKNMIQLFYPRALYPKAEEQDEEQEDKLLKFFASEKSVQLLTGSAGTGKSRYALKFLDHQIKYRETEGLNLLYVTMNKELANHMNDEWQTAKQRLKLGQSGIYDGKFDLTTNPENNNISFLSIDELLGDYYRDTEGEFRQFEQFERKLDEFSKDPSVKRDGTTQPPPAKAAWLEFKEILFDTTGKPRFQKIEDYHKHYKNENAPGYLRDEKDGRGKTTERKFLWHFTFNKRSRVTNRNNNSPYSNWAYRCRDILNDGKKRRQLYDVIVIDEVQDLDVSIISFIISLINPIRDKQKSLEKSILLTGDQAQTVNLSGFSWINLVDEIAEILENENNNYNHITKIFRSKDPQLQEIERLKVTWRNPPTIASFNRDAYLTFDSKGDKTYTVFDNKSYIEPYRKKYAESGVINIISNNPEETVLRLQELIYFDADNRAQFRDPFIVSPQNINDDSFENKLALKTYSAKQVKGLEANVIVVLNPYEITKKDLIPREQSEQIMEPERFDKWKEHNQPLIRKLQNIQQYSMNVLFTRAQKLLFIIWPDEGEISSGFQTLGENFRLSIPKLFDRPEDLAKREGVSLINHDECNKELIDSFRDSNFDFGSLDSDYWEQELLKSYNLKDENLTNLRKSIHMYVEHVPIQERKFSKFVDIVLGKTNNVIIDNILSKLYDDSYKKAIQKKYDDFVNFFDKSNFENSKYVDIIHNRIIGYTDSLNKYHNLDTRYKLSPFLKENQGHLVHNSAILRLIAEFENFFFNDLFGEIYNTGESDSFESLRLKQQLQREVFNKYLNTKYSEDDFTKLGIIEEFRNQCQDLAKIISLLTNSDFDWKDIIQKTYDGVLEINLPLMKLFYKLLFAMFKKSDDYGNLDIKELGGHGTKRRKDIEEEGLLNFNLIEQVQFEKVSHSELDDLIGIEEFDSSYFELVVNFVCNSLRCANEFNWYNLPKAQNWEVQLSTIANDNMNIHHALRNISKLYEYEINDSDAGIVAEINQNSIIKLLLKDRNALFNKIIGFSDNNAPLGDDIFNDERYADFVLHRIENKYSKTLYKEVIIPDLFNHFGKVKMEASLQFRQGEFLGICNNLVGNFATYQMTAKDCDIVSFVYKYVFSIVRTETCTIRTNDDRIKFRSRDTPSGYFYESSCDYFDRALWETKSIIESRDGGLGFMVIVLFTNPDRMHQYSTNSFTKYVNRTIIDTYSFILNPEVFFSTGGDGTFLENFDYVSQKYLTNLILSNCDEENKAKFAAILISNPLDYFVTLLDYQKGGLSLSLEGYEMFNVSNPDSSTVEYNYIHDVYPESHVNETEIYRDINEQLDYVDSDLFEVHRCDTKLTFERVNEILLKYSNARQTVGSNKLVEWLYHEKYEEICDYLANRFPNKKATEIASSLILPKKYCVDNLETNQKNDLWTGVVERVVNCKYGTACLHLDEVLDGDKGLTINDYEFTIADNRRGQYRRTAFVKGQEELLGELHLIKEVKCVIRNGKKLTISEGRRKNIITKYYQDREDYVRLLRFREFKTNFSSIVTRKNPRINLNNLIISTSWPYFSTLNYYSLLNKKTYDRKRHLIKLYPEIETLFKHSHELHHIISNPVASYSLYYYDLMYITNNKDELLTELVIRGSKNSKPLPFVMTRKEFVDSIGNQIKGISNNIIKTKLWGQISGLQKGFQEDMNNGEIKTPFASASLLAEMHDYVEMRGFLPSERARYYILLQSLRFNIFDKHVFETFSDDIAKFTEEQLLSFIGHQHNYSYYTMEMDKFTNAKRHVGVELGKKPEATKNNTEYFIDINRFEEILDSEVVIDKPKPTKEYTKQKYNLSGHSFSKISGFIDKKYHDMIIDFISDKFEAMVKHVVANQKGYNSHSNVTITDLVNKFLLDDMKNHIPYVKDNFSRILRDLNNLNDKSNLYVVRVYDDDYTEWNEFLMHDEQIFSWSGDESELEYHIIDNTNYIMDDWKSIGINKVKISSWKKHILSINRITGIIDIINQDIDGVMSECNEAYPRLYAMHLREIENKVIDANTKLGKILDEGYTLPESVVLHHLKQNHVRIRYEIPVNTENEGTIMNTQIMWTTEYVAAKEIGWKRGDKPPIAFQDGNIMRIKKG